MRVLERRGRAEEALLKLGAVGGKKEKRACGLEGVEDTEAGARLLREKFRLGKKRVVGPQEGKPPCFSCLSLCCQMFCSLSWKRRQEMLCASQHTAPTFPAPGDTQHLLQLLDSISCSSSLLLEAGKGEHLGRARGRLGLEAAAALLCRALHHGPSWAAHGQ